MSAASFKAKLCANFCEALTGREVGREEEETTGAGTSDSIGSASYSVSSDSTAATGATSATGASVACGSAIDDSCADSATITSGCCLNAEAGREVELLAVFFVLSGRGVATAVVIFEDCRIAEPGRVDGRDDDEIVPFVAVAVRETGREEELPVAGVVEDPEEVPGRELGREDDEPAAATTVVPLRDAGREAGREDEEEAAAGADAESPSTTAAAASIGCTAPSSEEAATAAESPPAS